MRSGGRRLGQSQCAAARRRRHGATAGCVATSSSRSRKRRARAQRWAGPLWRSASRRAAARRSTWSGSAISQTRSRSSPLARDSKASGMTSPRVGSLWTPSAAGENIRTPGTIARIAPPSRCRPPRPPARDVPGWFPGSGVSLWGPAWRLPGAKFARWLCATPLLRYRCGGSVGLAPTSQFSPLVRAGHLERRHPRRSAAARACECDIAWSRRARSMATHRTDSSKKTP